MDRPTLQEQLDACRSAAQAANDPLLRELAEALRGDRQVAEKLENQLAADSLLKSELENVSVPNHLPSMLLQAFRAGAAEHQQSRGRVQELVGQGVDEAISTRPETDEAVAERSKLLLTPKRRLPKKSIAVLAVASAVLLAFFALQFNGAAPALDWDAQRFAKEARTECLKEGGSWNDISSGVGMPLKWDPKALPLVGNPQPLKWKSVHQERVGKWVVWELNASAGERVYVLAAEAPWRNGLLPPVLSQTPTLPSTGNWTVGVCRVGQISYAVVVEGGDARFRELIRRAEMAWAKRLNALRATNSAT